MILNATELIRRIEGDNELEDVYPVEHRGFLNALRSHAIEVRDRLCTSQTFLPYLNPPFF